MGGQPNIVLDRTFVAASQAECEAVSQTLTLNPLHKGEGR